MSNSKIIKHKKHKNAYVCLLYGSSSYTLGALIVGYTLKVTKTNYDRVILITPDVNREHIDALKLVFNRIIHINYVKVNPKIIHEYEKNRFRDIYTKLQCFKLEEYDKIIFMDIDMLVLQNMDHLFALSPPSACLRRYKFPHGQLIPKNMILNKEGRLVGGINAGLMLLHPDKKEYKNILEDLNKENNIIRLRTYKNPEQDYLSYRYAGKWTNIDFKYNYQFGLTFRTEMYNYNIKDIYNIHYSSHIKPWGLLTKDEKELNYIKRKLSENKDLDMKFYNIWLTTYEELKQKLIKFKGIDISKFVQ